MAASGQYPNELPEVLEFLVEDELIGIRGGVLFRAPTSTAAAASAASIRVNSATFATIPTLTASCFVFVAADETNDNLPTVYFFDGTNLNWLPSVGV